MRLGLAIILAGVAVAGAVYFGSLQLGRYRYSYLACPNEGVCIKNVTHSYLVPKRAVWQIPVAIVIAAVGIGAAVVLARSS